MDIIDLNNNELNFKSKKVTNLIIGHFSLLHKGHFKLLEKVDTFSFLIFHNNPNKNKRIYTIEERIKNIAKFNPQNIFVFDISKDNMESQTFIDKILLKISPKNILVGSDFKFGRNKGGDVALLKKFFNVITVQKDEIYSSSKIINLIENNNISKANEMMLIKFYYSNKVIEGKGAASKFSIPTANIEDNKNINVKSGSFYSVTRINDKLFHSISFIGKSKSYDSKVSLVETHLFDFSDNIYGKDIEVYPLIFIRENQKFDDLQSLVQAIENDIKKAKLYSLSNNLSNFDNGFKKD